MTSKEIAVDYFKRLYLTFKDEIGTRTPRRKQFASFSVDMAGDSHDRPIYRGQNFGDGGLLTWDFAVATTCRGSNREVQHAEERILCHLITNLDHMTHLADHAPHSLLLFTYFSPCDECIIFLDQLLHGLRSTIPRMTTTLGYMEMYVERSDRKMTSDAARSVANVEALYKLEQQFPGFRVVEIPNVANQDAHAGKLYVLD